MTVLPTYNGHRKATDEEGDQKTHGKEMQGCHASCKVLEFFLQNVEDLESPGKWYWFWKVREI